MKKLINIILIIAVIIVIGKILPWIIGGIVVIGFLGWIYFKYTKRKILKKINEYEEEMNKGTYYNNSINNSTKTNKQEKDNYDGPIIDVDYEDVNRK